MCTLTIVREGRRVLVTMNRDDVAARVEAPPRHWPNGEPAFAAPRDLQAGGTWIGVNAHGVIACLLNRYDAAAVGRTTRGQIVIEAMRGATMETANGVLAALDHRAYSPFTCLLITNDSATRLDWTGSTFDRTDLACADRTMATSSSWQSEEVRAQREALFRQIWSDAGTTADKIAAFHTRRVDAHDAWAPMMLRPTTQTKSITQVELTPHGAEMRYWTREAAVTSKLSAPETSIRVGTGFA
jgi:hypothetical protein